MCGGGNVTCLPLGPGNAAVDISEGGGECGAEPARLCTFTGNLVSPTHRSGMKAAMEQCDVTHSLNLTGSGGVDGRYYDDVVGARFCLLPGGNNYETFRVYEALEWGGCVGVLIGPVPEEYVAVLDR